MTKGTETLFPFLRRKLAAHFVTRRCSHEWQLAYGPYGDRFLCCDKCGRAK